MSQKLICCAHYIAVSLHPKHPEDGCCCKLSKDALSSSLAHLGLTVPGAGRVPDGVSGAAPRSRLSGGQCQSPPGPLQKTWCLLPLGHRSGQGQPDPVGKGSTTGSTTHQVKGLQHKGTGSIWVCTQYSHNTCNRPGTKLAINTYNEAAVRICRGLDYFTGIHTSVQSKMPHSKT